LRERAEDIPSLVRHFAEHYAKKAGEKDLNIDPDALEFLTSYPWHGNIRELQNVIERSVILCDSPVLSVDESGFGADADELVCGVTLAAGSADLSRKAHH